MAGADEVKNLMLQVDASVELARRNLRSLVGEVDRFQRSTDAALDKADKDFAQFGGGISKAAGSMRGLIAGAFTGAALIQFGKSAVQATQQFRGFEQALKIVTGSTAAASQELDYVAGVADRIGFKVTELAGAYVGLSAASRGTTLEGQRTRDIFEAITSAAAAYGLTNEQLEGSLLAVQQMISKGTVSAEELRGQLGERLPGAFQIAARAMGVTTSELDDMLKKGEVVAGDFLPKFVAQLQKEVPAGTQAAGAGFAQLSNRWDEFLRVVGDDLGLFDTLAAGARNLASAIGDINAQLQGSERISRGKGFGGALDVFFSSKQTLEQSATPTGHAAALRNTVGSLQAELRAALKAQKDAKSFGDIDWSKPLRGQEAALFGGDIGAGSKSNIGALQNRLKQARAELAAYLASPEYREAKNSLRGDFETDETASTGGGSSKPGKMPKTKVSALEQWRQENSAERADDDVQSRLEFLSNNQEATFRRGIMEREIGLMDDLWNSLSDVEQIIDRDINDAMEQWYRWGPPLVEQFRNIEENGVRNVSAGLADVIVYGEDLGDVLVNSFKRAAAAMLEATIQAKVLGPLLDNIRNGGSGGGGGFLSSVGTALSSFFGGGRATGGPVQRGMVYEVGEQGRELFVPRVNGDIISNQNLRRMVGGAGGQALTVNVDARGATDPAMVAAAARRAVYEAAPAIIRMSAKTTMDGFSRPTLQGGWG